MGPGAFSEDAHMASLCSIWNPLYAQHADPSQGEHRDLGGGRDPSTMVVTRVRNFSSSAKWLVLAGTSNHIDGVALMRFPASCSTSTTRGKQGDHGYRTSLDAPAEPRCPIYFIETAINENLVMKAGFPEL